MNRINRILRAAFLCALINLPARAETNLFQRFHPGDLVQVNSEHPLIALHNARFEGQTTNSITVLSKGDRYSFSKTNVVLTPVEDSRDPAPTSRSALRPSSAPGATPGTAALLGLKPEDLRSQLLAVQQAVLSRHSADPHYADAQGYYQKTMDGFLSGRVTIPDLADKAEETLKKLDEFQPERQRDPQFEGEISQLRDFVRRARSAEGLAMPPPQVE